MHKTKSTSINLSRQRWNHDNPIKKSTQAKDIKRNRGKKRSDERESSLQSGSSDSGSVYRRALQSVCDERAKN